MRMLSPISGEWYWPRASAAGFDDFDRIIESFLRPVHAKTFNFQPSCDVNETKDHYLVSFDMPGVKKEDIKVEVQENQLMISGERHGRNGRFERSFTLPENVSAEKIEAQYENGVLNLALPKVEAAKPRTIEIKSGEGGFFGKLLNSTKETA